MQVWLVAPWTDDAGVMHNAGELVEVDALTLARMESAGVVEDFGSGTVQVEADEHSQPA